MFGCQQGIGDVLGEGLGLWVEVGYGWGVWVDCVGYGEVEVSEIVWCGVNGFFGYVVEVGCVDVGDEQWVLCMLGDVFYCGVELWLDFYVGSYFDGFVFY